MITDEDKERVRQATDFVQLVEETVELRRRGNDYWGCCPFHHEKTPSFKVNPQTGLWKCFGCGLGGDVFTYVMHRENLEFPDAIRFLADRAGVELVEERGTQRGPKRNRLVECLDETQRFYATMLMRGRGSGPAEARSYFSGRGFGSAVCRRWGLGYAPGHGLLVQHLSSKGFTRQEMEAADVALVRNGRLVDRFYDRVMFPINDEQGRTIAFGGRVLTDAKPKYLNTKETRVFHKGKHLFAFDKAKEHIVARGEAIVCEGYTDVMALHEAGYPIAVAALGTSFSIDHVRTLSRFAKRIICMFDGDAAGQRAAERAVQFIDKSEADLRCVVLPGGQDPDEFLDTHRASDLEPILADAQPLMNFVLDKRLGEVSPASPAGVRLAKLDELASVLAPLKDSVVLDGYAMEVAAALGMQPEGVRAAIRTKPRTAEQAGASKSGAYRNSANRGNVSGNAWSTGYGAPPTPAEYGPVDYVPDDYVPTEAYDAFGSAMYGGAQEEQAAYQGSSVLSTDERMQLRAEQELLSLMAANIDGVRPYAERIATLSWMDEQHEAMAWAMLATPEGTPAAEVVHAASLVVSSAPQVLSSGSVVSAERMDEQTKVAFVLDTVELYSTRRKIMGLRAQLRSGGSSSAQSFQEATRLQQHANELSERLSRY